MEDEGDGYRNDLINDVGYCVKLGAQESEEDARNRRRSRCCTGERRDDESPVTMMIPSHCTEEM